MGPFLGGGVMCPECGISMILTQVEVIDCQKTV